MNPKASALFNLFNPIHFLALGFGSGLAPKAPGTFGTLMAVPLVILVSPIESFYLALIIVLMSITGVYICGKAAADAGVHDHGAIVWDEIVGLLITMFMMQIVQQA